MLLGQECNWETARRNMEAKAEGVPCLSEIDASIWPEFWWKGPRKVVNTYHLDRSWMRRHHGYPRHLCERPRRRYTGCRLAGSCLRRRGRERLQLSYLLKWTGWILRFGSGYLAVKACRERWRLRERRAWRQLIAEAGGMAAQPSG